MFGKEFLFGWYSLKKLHTLRLINPRSVRNSTILT